jgi:8-oxo-dGTP pyrophosphatase MutT (NUDIX family)
MRVRVAALVVTGGRILLARHEKEGRTSYLLPGGGVDPHETAHEALAREIHEEASARCAIGALRYVVEARAVDGTRHLVQLVFVTDLLDAVGRSSDPRVVACEWHAFEELGSLPIHPSFGSRLEEDLKKSGTAFECRYLLAPWVD